MRKKLDNKTRYFFKNLVLYFFIVAIAVYAVKIGWGTEEPRMNTSLLNAVALVGIVAIVILGFKIALDMTRSAYFKKKR